MLNMHAARMGRVIACNYQATAPCTRDTSSRIHQPTVSVDHGKRDRCARMPGAHAALLRGQARPARRHDQPGRGGQLTGTVLPATSRETRETVKGGCILNRWYRRGA